MVAVNPGEQYGVSPTADPEYTSYRWSRVIPEPEANKSGEILSKGLGAALLGGAEGINKAYETAAKTAAEEGKEAADTKIISDLQSALSMAKGTKVASNDAMSSFASVEPEGPEKLNILSTDKKAVLPDQVKDAPRIAQNLEAARANGTYSNSYGDMIKASYLKNVRDKYPGYRGVVDRAFGDPANATITALLGDLNSYARAASENNKAALTEIRKEVSNGTPGADLIAAGAEQGKYSNAQVYKWINQANLDKYQERVAKHNWEMSEIGDKQRGNLAEKSLQTKAETGVSQILNTVSVITNTGDAVGVNKVLSGEIASGNFDTQHSLEMGQQLLSARQAIVARYNKESHEVQTGTGRTLSLDSTEEKSQKILQENLKPLDAYIDRIMNHEHGSANYIKSMNAAVKDQSINQVLTDKGIGQQVAKSDAFRTLLGPAAEPLLMQMWSGATDLGGKAQSMIMEHDVSMAVQMHAPKDVVTFNHTLETIQNDKELAKQGPQLAKKVLGFSDRIVDPKLPVDVRANYAIAAFSHPDLLDRFAQEHQLGIYQRFGSASFAANVKKLADQGHPEVWSNYQHFMEESFGSPNRGLFSQRVRDLDEQSGSSQALRFTFDSETNHYGVERKRGVGPELGGIGSPTGEVSYLNAQGNIKALNDGIDTLKNVHAQTGVQDMNAYLATMLKSMGVDTSQGIGQSLLMAMVNSRLQKEEEQKP